MLNYIWAIMLIVGIVFGALTGHMKDITEAALNSAGEAVSLSITMLGIMAFWMGLMEIADKSGLIKKITSALSPFVQFMFPHLPREHKAREYISTNLVANILGLGWACTPAGLKAMEELSKLQKERRVPEEKLQYASNEMCTFLILNISSLQLIPINMIAYRSKYGSVNPTLILAPAIIATLISLIASIIYCKYKEKC